MIEKERWITLGATSMGTALTLWVQKEALTVLEFSAQYQRYFHEAAPE